MARVTTQTISVSAGVTAAQPASVPLDYQIANYNIGYGVTKSGTGDVTYSVQRTMGDVLGGGTLRWFDVVSGKTTSFDGNFTMPSAGVRLQVTAVSGVSTLNFDVQQSGVT